MTTVKEYINLLPVIETKPARFMNAWSIGSLLFMLIWLLLLGLKAMQWRDLQTRRNSLEPQKKMLEQQLTSIREELGLTAVPGKDPETTTLIQNLLKERVLWSEVFHQFSQIIPHGVWFDSLEGSAGDTAEIRIRGGAFNYRLISDFMLGMEQSGYFVKPELLAAQKAAVQGHDVVGFDIRCGLKRP